MELERVNYAYAIKFASHTYTAAINNTTTGCKLSQLLKVQASLKARSWLQTIYYIIPFNLTVDFRVQIQILVLQTYHLQHGTCQFLLVKS